MLGWIFSKGYEGGHLAKQQPVARGAHCMWLLGYLFFVEFLCLCAKRIELFPRDL